MKHIKQFFFFSLIPKVHTTTEQKECPPKENNTAVLSKQTQSEGPGGEAKYKELLN